MKLHRPFTLLASLLLSLLFFCAPAHAQAGFDDDRVMLQGFYWESHRHGHPDKFPSFGQKRWYTIVEEQAPTLREARVDLIWLPPPSFAGDHSAGYGPKEYFRLDNSYGTHDQHRAMLEALLKSGVEPIADIVINHRDGTQTWATFKNPDWDTTTICKNDECFHNSASEVNNTPENQRGAEEEFPKEYATHKGTTYQYASFRDLDHTNVKVRQDIIRHLKQLQSLGYRGWRYDMVHGFHAKWLATYNRHTKPTFSVGEYDWAAHDDMRGWSWHTATDPKPSPQDHLKTSSSVFDFTTFTTLKTSKGSYAALYGFGNGLGIVGDNTDNLPWKNRAVTFLENHDTGYRTDFDGNPEKDHLHDSFANTWEVEQGYAYILTHPGLPTVYWKHYFDWGSDLRNKINALVNARKVARVHAGSRIHPQDNARAKGVYAAMIQGRPDNNQVHELYVRIGGTDSDWQPSHSNYTGHREYAQGAGWKVWVKHPDPAFHHAPLKPPLPIPTYTKPEQIPDVSNP